MSLGADNAVCKKEFVEAMRAVLDQMTPPHGSNVDPPSQANDNLGALGTAVFNIATKDAQTWSGLTRLAEVADRLGPALRRFRDDAGQELLDLPDAPRPGPEVPAPPRFLPEYDNVLLSHADRSRIVTGGRPIPLPPGFGGTRGTLLVDGMFQGTWQITRSGQRATLRIETFARPAGTDAGAVTEEGARLLAFAAAGADPDVVLSAAGS